MVWCNQGCAECVEDACATLFFMEMGRLDIGKFMIGECDVEHRDK